MTEQDRPRFTQALIALVEVLGGEITEAGHALYFAALRDLEWESLQTAFARAVTQCRFLPKPVELREFAGGAVETGEDRAERAWLAWRNAARVVGSYRSLVLRDVALADTLCAIFGGWPEACAAEFSDEMWAAKRKEFGRVYRVMQGRVDGRQPVCLPGHHGRTNALSSHAGAARLPACVPVLAIEGDVEWQEPAGLLAAGESSGALQRLR